MYTNLVCLLIAKNNPFTHLSYNLFKRNKYFIILVEPSQKQVIFNFQQHHYRVSPYCTAIVIAIFLSYSGKTLIITDGSLIDLCTSTMYNIGHKCPDDSDFRFYDLHTSDTAGQILMSVFGRRLLIMANRMTLRRDNNIEIKHD